MAYQKPVIGALSMDSENCGCNFFVNDAGEGFFFYAEGGVLPGSDGSAIIIETPVGPVNAGLPGAAPPQLNPAAVAQNNVASVGDGSASVTPLANTGLPATQPIVFGVPVGVYGVHANVGPSASNTTANVDSSALAVRLLGITLDVPFF